MPPVASLSGDGRHVAVVFSRRAWVLTPSTGHATAVGVERAALATMSPDGSRIAVADGGRISVFDREDPSRPMIRLEAPLRGTVVRVAVGRHALAAVVQGEGSHHLVLGPLDGRHEGVLTPGRIVASCISGLRLAEEYGRLIIWAAEAEGPGVSRPVGYAVDLATREVIELWGRRPPAFVPFGCLYPLDGGKIGLYRRELLVLLDLFARPGQPAREVVVHDMETAVSSPGGRFVAWLWSQGGVAAGMVCSLDLEEERVVMEADIGPVGAFPALAVDDAGTVTAVFGGRPDRAVVVEAAPRTPVKTGELTPWRRDPAAPSGGAAPW